MIAYLMISVVLLIILAVGIESYNKVTAENVFLRRSIALLSDQDLINPVVISKGVESK